MDLRTKPISASAAEKSPPYVPTHGHGHGQSRSLLCVTTANTVPPSELMCRRKQSNEIPWDRDRRGGRQSNLPKTIQGLLEETQVSRLSAGSQCE